MGHRVMSFRRRHAESGLFVYQLPRVEPGDCAPETDRDQHMAKLLEDLGFVHFKSVDIFIPGRITHRIFEEILFDFRPQLEGHYGQLPGLLISEVPIEEIKPDSGAYTFIPYGDVPFDQLGDVAQAIVPIIQEHTRKSAEGLSVGLGRRAWEAFEIKPGLFGFKIDLKKLFVLK